MMAEQKQPENELDRRSAYAYGAMKSAFAMGVVLAIVSFAGLALTKWF